MTLQVGINGQDLRPLLSKPPVIKDKINAVCRTLELTPKNSKDLENYLGQPVELMYGGEKWFYGFLQTRSYNRSYNSNKKAIYKAYDPLFFFKNNPDDYYFKNMTATQAIKQLASDTALSIGSLANTQAVFKKLYYPGKDPEEIAIDLLARTYQQTNKKYWFRYVPGEGLTLFERKVPTEVWAFLEGVNLLDTRFKETIKEAKTMVKLVNRETGKKVTKGNVEKLKQWGRRTEFKEVDKSEAETMERKAAELLDKLSKVKTTQSFRGINPDHEIPQLYSGDVVYVEEKETKVAGAYHIKNITQTFKNDNLVEISADIQRAPDIPEIKYEDATEMPDADESSGVQEDPKYSDELKKVIEKYGLQE